jgi:hypothetical protein
LEDHVDWEACQAAFEEDPDLRVLGDLHTHPFTARDCAHLRSAGVSRRLSPSQTDWDDRLGLRWVTGICLLEQGPKGRMRAEFRYWGPLTPLDLRSPIR